MDFLRSKIDGKEIIIKTVKDKKGKYGRYLADIFLASGEGKWININDLAVYKDY